MWDVPAALQSALELAKEIFKRNSPEQKSKARKVRRANQSDESRKNWRAFSARARRFLARFRLILFFLALYSCAHSTPEVTDLQERLKNCQQDRQEVMETLLECLDRGDALQDCP